MSLLVVIPARYASTRFPGKPLALLGGRPVIQHVWERVCGLADRAVVATDDERIVAAVEAFGGTAMMTSSNHRSGTDRCGEVVRRLAEQGERFDVVINVQGDEPFVKVEQLEQLASCFDNVDVQIATLRTHITSTDELLSKNNVKVVCDMNGNALYFSRQPIPLVRGVEECDWLSKYDYYKHVGIYAFQCDTLLRLTQLQPSALESAESLEQLRWIENGYRIAVRTTSVANIGIDTPDDLAAAERYLAEQKMND